MVLPKKLIFLCIILKINLVFTFDYNIGYRFYIGYIYRYIGIGKKWYWPISNYNSIARRYNQSQYGTSCSRELKFGKTVCARECVYIQRVNTYR
jgi:hypothetical protein